MPRPGIAADQRDSFFARTHSTEESNARQYLGIAAQGRSPKVIMLRVYLALLAAAQKAYWEAGGKKVDHNPADPYMTLLGYFNSLRELGGARRLIEDEVRTQQHVRNALEIGELCSNDPVCAQHDPANAQERRFLHGAACHGCLLISETSCEHHNEFLDRT